MSHEFMDFLFTCCVGVICFGALGIVCEICELITYLYIRALYRAIITLEKFPTSIWAKLIVWPLRKIKGDEFYAECVELCLKPAEHEQE